MTDAMGWRARAGATVVFCAGALLAGCAGNGDGLDATGRPIGENGPSPPPPPGEGGFQQIQDSIFTPVCTTCHAGAAAPVGLRLDAANSYAMLVNVPSTEVPSLLRVEPGDPDNSYLVQKIEGRAAVGARMPLDAPPLPQTSIDLVRAWIAGGAVAPASLSGERRPFEVVAATPPADALNATPVEALQLIFSAEIDPSLVQVVRIVVEASGGDGSFEEGNETVVPLADVSVSAVNPRMLTVRPAAPLAGDRFRLVVGRSAGLSLADVGARLLDGDADGQPGGDYTVSFRVLPREAK